MVVADVEGEVDEDVVTKVNVKEVASEANLVAVMAERTFAEVGIGAGLVEHFVDKAAVGCPQEEMDVDQVAEEEPLRALNLI